MHTIVRQIKLDLDCYIVCSWSLYFRRLVNLTWNKYMNFNFKGRMKQGQQSGYKLMADKYPLCGRQTPKGDGFHQLSLIEEVSWVSFPSACPGYNITTIDPNNTATSAGDRMRHADHTASIQCCLQYITATIEPGLQAGISRRRKLRSKASLSLWQV